MLSCPYCNAAVAVAELPPSRRVACPRCGETFPVKSLDGAAPHIPTASANGTLPPAPPPAKSGAPLVLVGAVAGLVVAAVGLYFVFRDGGTPADPTPPSAGAATVPPAAVPALAFVPADADVAFVVQPGPLLAYADRANADPRKVLLAAGVPEPVLAALDRAGLKPEQIDHVAAAAVVADNAFPRLVVAAVLTGPPADRDALLKQLKATQFTARSGATRYKVDVGLPTTLEMQNPDPRTYLFATDGKDLDAAATAKGRGSAHLSAGLRESMGQLSPASCVWVATDAAAWADRPAVKAAAFLLKQPDLPARLAGVRALAIGTALEPDPRRTAAVRAADADAGKRLREQAQAALAGKPLTVGGDGPWATAAGPPDQDTWAALRPLLK